MLWFTCPIFYARLYPPRTAKISCPLRPVVVADTAAEEAIQYKYKGGVGGGERLRSDGWDRTDVPRNDGKTSPDAPEALDQSPTDYPSDRNASFYRSSPLSVASLPATLRKLLIAHLRLRPRRVDTKHRRLVTGVHIVLMSTYEYLSYVQYHFSPCGHRLTCTLNNNHLLISASLFIFLKNIFG